MVLVPGWAMAARWGWRPAIKGSEAEALSWKGRAMTARELGSASMKSVTSIFWVIDAGCLRENREDGLVVGENCVMLGLGIKSMICIYVRVRWNRVEWVSTY